MKRHVTALTALLLAACAPPPMQTRTTGELVVSNPLAARFHGMVVPETTRSLGILVTTTRDGQTSPVALATLSAIDRQKVLTGLPVGPVTITAVAFDGQQQALAAASGEATIVPVNGGPRAQVTLDLSTDEGVLKRLADAIALIRPTPSPSANPLAADPSPKPSTAPLPSQAPSAPPSPSATPLFPFPFFNPNLVDTFSGTALDPTKWISQLSGSPTPSLTVADGLTLTMAPDTRPSGEAFARCEITTAKMSAFDIQVATHYRLTSWPTDATNTRFGLVTDGTALYRTTENGRHVYVFERTGDADPVRQTQPAPPPGADEEMRLERRGGRLTAMAGPVGTAAVIGQASAPTGFIPLTIGIRSQAAGPAGVSAAVRDASLSLVSTTHP